MFQFPPSPIPGQTFTPVAGVTYRWSGTAWHLIAGPGSFLTPTDADTRYVNIDEAQNTTNRIINGKFAIDQRNAFASVQVVPGPSLFGPDRWNGYAVGTGTFWLGANAGQNMVLSTGTVDATLTTTDQYLGSQNIEGYNVADLQFGTASAQPFTFAFSIFPALGGVLPVAFRNSDGSRSYVTTVALTASVWNSCVVTVPGDTTGTWNSTNGIGLRVDFCRGAGSTYLAPAANAWQAGNHLTVAGATNFMATANSMYIDDVRLYKGSVDFGPDRRLYAEELALCQRYYCKSYNIDVVPGAITSAGTRAMMPLNSGGFSGISQLVFPVRMRTVPTITLLSSGTGAVGMWRGNAVDLAVGIPEPASDGHALVFNTGTVTAAQTIQGHFTASAEL